jgi:hypothetical protein
MGVVGGTLVGEELGDDKEFISLLLDDVEFEMKNHGCKHYAKHPKKGSLTDSHLPSANKQDLPAKKRAIERCLSSRRIR